MWPFLTINNVITWKGLLSVLLFLSTIHPCFSDYRAVFPLSNLEDWGVILNQNWKFYPGDNPSWADPDFDDSHWTPIDPTTDIHYLPELREAEIGWFRLHLDVDSSLLNIPLAMVIFQRGASEIFLNGKLIHQLGVVSRDSDEEIIFNPNNIPYSFQFQKAQKQVLAVRFSFTKRNPYMNFLGLWGGNPALVIQVKEMDVAVQSMLHSKAEVTSRLVGKATFLMFLALLHLFFFITYPANKTNLYYCLFTMSLSMGYFLEHVFRWMPREGDSFFIIGLISSLFFAQFIIWGLLAVYSFAKEKPNAIFWFAVVSTLLWIPSWKWPYEAANYYWPYAILIGPMVAIWTSIKAIRKNIKGAWLVFSGWAGNFVFWLLFCLFRFNVLPRFHYDLAITLDLAVFCAAITFSVLLAIEFAYTKRSLQSSLLEVEVKRLETEKMQELDKTKSDFFANISHEFRTPLTLISGTLEQLRNDEPPSNSNEEYGLIKRNADRLLQLVNQLLDLSKLEAGKLKLEKQPKEIIGFLKRLAGTFASRFESKSIRFICELPADPLYVSFDQDKLEKVISNLLMNAFKFTSANGEVKFKVSVLSVNFNIRQLQLTVQDNGIGISKERIPHIFERFYQADVSSSRSYEGTGIGLALVKELAELHGGTITVTSTPGSGTSFFVTIPMELASREEIDLLKIKEALPILPVNPPDTENIIVEESEFSADEKNDLPRILVVEDNFDLREFIIKNLTGQYNLLEAENGKEGYNKAIDTIPDLVISDVMMPEMDGVNMCEKLKKDERTSHIPLILLTARADSESKIGGLETGADDYLTKPFEMVELKVRIKNLIEGRQKLREQFSRSLTLYPLEVAVSSKDENFLKKTLNILEANLGNNEFGVENFSREVGMSRVHLHRKLKALTDQSPSEFIRTYRLKRAASLLEQHAGNISDVAYSVGFNSVNYFTKCFREQFGETPSDFSSASTPKKAS